MHKYESIEKDIASRNIKGLREDLGNICYAYRDFSNNDFDENLAYVKSKVPEVMEDTLVGELISKGKTSYTHEDFANAVFELKNNFCNERIADVKKIGKALYKSAPKPAQSASAGSNTPKKASGRRSRKNIIPAALIIIAAAVLIILVISIVKE